MGNIYLFMYLFIYFLWGLNYEGTPCSQKRRDRGTLEKLPNQTVETFMSVGLYGN